MSQEVRPNSTQNCLVPRFGLFKLNISCTFGILDDGAGFWNQYKYHQSLLLPLLAQSPVLSSSSAGQAEIFPPPTLRESCLLEFRGKKDGIEESSMEPPKPLESYSSLPSASLQQFGKHGTFYHWIKYYASSLVLWQHSGIPSLLAAKAIRHPNKM
jgi:hypothetical protein